MKNLRCLFIVFILIAQVSFAGTITPNWSWDIPTEADPTDWDGRYETIFSAIDTIIPKGTTDYQTPVWDATNGKWVANDVLNIDFVNGRMGIGTADIDAKIHILLGDAFGISNPFMTFQYNGITVKSYLAGGGVYTTETSNMVSYNIITSGNTNQFYLKSDGNVGINCIPDTKLHVVDNSGSPQQTWSHTQGAIESSWLTDAAGVTTLATTGNGYLFNINGTDKIRITATEMAALGVNGWRLLGENVSATNPVFSPSASDADTGVGRAEDDQLSLISGAIEGQRIVEDIAWGVSTHAPEVTATPTAIPNYFSVYTKSDDMLYYQDGAGNEHQIARKVAVPTTATDTCTIGDYAVESGFRYECVATDTWQRSTLSTW